MPSSQLNVENDVAVCSECDEVFAISELVAAGQDTGDFDLSDAPRGAWFSESFTGWTIGATTRSPAALLVVPFTCVWSGLSIFMLYGSQVVAGEFDLGMSLFGIPFLLATVLLCSIATMCICGKVTVTVDQGAGRVFAGVGAIGWVRRFDWEAVTRIEEDHLGYHYTGSQGRVIALIGETRTKFGSMLSKARRHYVLLGLRKMLAERSN